MDFIALLLLEDTLVIIISIGDIAEDLASILDKFDDIFFLKQLLGEIQYTFIIICCARSSDREDSTYRMLSKRIDASDRSEFWTKKSDNEDKNTIKTEVIEAIINKIKITHRADRS